MVTSTYYFELAFIDSFRQDGLRCAKLFHNIIDVVINGIIQELIIAPCCFSLINSRLYVINQTTQVAWCFSAFYDGSYCSAAIVSQHDDQWHIQVLYCIFNAGQGDVIHDLPGSPDHKDVSQALIKDNLRWNPGVGTSYNNGKGMLSGDEFAEAIRRLVRVSEIARSKPRVALHEFL